MTVLKRVVDSDGNPVGWRHQCPGCRSPHVIRCEQPERNGARWSFDGDEARPTFSPSVHIRWGHYASGEGVEGCLSCRVAKERDCVSPCGVCHYFVHAGTIQFCGDSTHALSGQTVFLPELV